MPESTTTRLAPSPTGALHVGNARTFLVNYLLARRRGWQVLMRVEDLDGPRVKPEATAETLAELAWMGLDWSEPVVHQSMRSEAYAEALERLAAAGQAYPCVCSRKDVIEAASAPHAEDAHTPYPGTCCNRFVSAVQAASSTGRPAGWRVRAPARPIEVRDEFAGPHTFDLAKICGDFVIYQKNGLAAYQLAVVIDDAAAGVDAVVRGDDLLESAARQIHLRRLLDLAPEPRYWHLPLVLGPDGRRLAKRHGDTRLGHYRDAGCTPERMCGLLGYLCGILERRREADVDELVDRFELGRLPKEPVVFTPDDDAFLLGA